MSDISFSLVDPLAAASGVFVEQQAIRGSLGSSIIPQRILLIGQYNSGKTPTEDVAQVVLSPDDAANRYGLGSLLHLMAVAAFKGCGSVPVYACPVGDGVGQATGTINIAVTTALAGEISLYIAGKRIPVEVSAGADVSTIEAAIVAAINADPNLPVTAAADSGDILVTAKWVGLSGNGITIETNLQVGDATPGGVTVTIVDMSGGTSDPATATALAALGDTWYTLIASPYNADTSLDELEAAGAARIDPGVRRPFLAIAGYVGSRANLLTALDSRNSQWSSLFPIEGSPNHPAEIAAAVVGEAALRAQVNPGRPYRGLVLEDIRPGTTGTWTYAQRDQMVKAGGSTFRVTPSETIAIEDLCTTRTQNDLGAPDASFRFAETIANLQAKIYSIEAVFESEPFISGVIVDDDSISRQEYAVRPKTVKAYVIRLIDELWEPRALTKNRDDVVAGIVVQIDSGNPNRINVFVPDVFAAGLKIVATKLNWSFYAPVGS